MNDAMTFLQGVSGFVRAESRSSADRPIKLARIDPTYDPWSTYPSAPPPARVTFEGESTLSGKAYGYVNGYVPWPDTRVYLLPIGSTYVIGGMINAPGVQGFWQNAIGTESGVEFGGGSYLSTDEGLVVAGDASVTGDLAVTGVGREVAAWKTGSTGRTATTVSADPHLVLNLTAGTWIVDFMLVMGAANGDLKTSWQTTGTLDPGYTLRTCWGPSPYSVDTAVADETQGRDAVPMRVSAHLFATEVDYGLNSTTLLASAWERGIIRYTTSGTLALAWCQAASDVPSPSVLAVGSYVTARKVEA